MMPMPLKLTAEYGGAVLRWGVGAADVGPVDPCSPPLTDDLRAALQRWADAYDRILNHSDPPNSGFADPSKPEAFEAEGMRLWRELQAQWGPNWSVASFGRAGTLTEAEENQMIV